MKRLTVVLEYLFAESAKLEKAIRKNRTGREYARERLSCGRRPPNRSPERASVIFREALGFFL